MTTAAVSPAADSSIFSQCYFTAVTPFVSQVNELSGATPAVQAAPSSHWSCCFRGTTCRSSGVGEHRRCGERSRGPRFPHGQAGAAAGVYSSLMFGYRRLPQKLSTNPKVKPGEPSIPSKLESKNPHQRHRI